MTSVEKRHSGRRGGVHRKHSDGGYSDTSSGGSFLDETDREVSNLTDKAFKSLCVGDEAVYNDSDLCPSSPTTQRERQLAFSHSGQDWDKEDSEREALKKAAHDTFSLKVQQYGQDWIQGEQYRLETQEDPQFGGYGEGRTEGRVSATFQRSFVDMSEQERSVRGEHLSFHSNGAMELGTQQRRSRSRVSSLIKAFDSDSYRDGGGLDSHLRDWNSETSWDKSALMSIQRELSEFSTAYHQSFNSGGFLSADPFSSRDNSLYSFEVAAAMGHMDSSSSFMRSHHNKHSMSTQLNSNSNFFMHSELSPFRVWRDRNRFPFRQGEVSGYVPHSEFPEWYETPMYKELSLGSPSQGPFMYEERGFRPHRKALESVAPPPPPRSTSTSMVLQRASALEKRCESELTGHYPPWKGAQSLGANRLPSQRPSAVSPTIEMSRHVRDTLTSITDLKQKITMMTTEQSITKEMMARQEGALHSNDSLTPLSNKVTTATVEQNVVSSDTSTTPFNINQLLTPVIHNTQQVTETSEVQQYSISPPMVEHAPVRAESRGATPDVRMSSYKSRATSLLFNLKDNRKRVKSTYSPTKFKGLETMDKNKQVSNQNSNEPPRDTVIDIPEFLDTLVPHVTVHEEPSIVDATLHPHLQGHHSSALPLTSQPTTAHIGQNTEYTSGDYLTPQMQGEMAYHPGFSGFAQGNYTVKDQLANGQNIQRELAPFTQFRQGEIGKIETLRGDVYRQANSNKPGVSNTLATAISPLPKPNLSPRSSYSTTDTPRVHVDSTNKNREYLITKDTTEQNPYESTGMGYTKVTENKYGYSDVSSQDSWRQQAYVNNTSSREAETLSPNDRLQPVRPPWKGEIAALIERDKLAQSSQRAAMMKHDIHSPRDKYGGEKWNTNKKLEKADLRQSLAEDTSSLPHPYHSVADHNSSNQLQHYAPHNNDTVPKGKQQPGTLTDTYTFQKHYGLTEEQQMQESYLAQNYHLYGGTEQEYRKQQLLYYDGDKNCMLTQQEPVQRKDVPLLEENQLLRYQQNEFEQHHDHSMQRNTLSNTEDQQYEENGHTTTNQSKDKHVEAKADQVRVEQIKAQHAQAELAKAQQAEKAGRELVIAGHASTEQAKTEQARAEWAERDREEQAKRAREEQAKAERTRTEKLKAERAKVEQIKAEKAKAEQAKREQAERARAEQAEAERIKAEQAEAERIKTDQIRAERIKVEQAEAERIKTEQIRAERIKVEQAEAEIIKTEQIRAERIKAEQAEAERIKAKQAEAERIKTEQIRAERIKAEQAEVERIKAKQAEAERIKTEQIRAERIKAEQAEAERIKAKQAEAEIIKTEQIRAERIKVEQAEAEKIKAEQAEAERIKSKQAEAERIKTEQIRAERIKAEQAEAERIKAKQAEAERIKTEQIRAERIKAEQAEAERIKAEAERIKAEQIRAERIKAEQAEAERIKAEQAEAERIKAEQVEAERIKAEQAEAERIKAEQAEAERIKAEQAEAERIKAEQAEAERIKAEQAEAERIKAEQAEAERIKAEQAEAESIKAKQAEAEKIKAEQIEAERIKAEQMRVEKIKAEQAEAERIKGEKAKLEQVRVGRMKAEQAKVELAKIEKIKAQSTKSKAKQIVTEQVTVEPAKVEQVKTELAKAKAELIKIKEKMRGEQKDKVRYSVSEKEGDITNQNVSVKVKCTKNEESREQGQTTQKYQQSEDSTISMYDRGIADRGPYDPVREKYSFSTAVSTNGSKVSLQDNSKSSSFAIDKEAVINKTLDNGSHLISRIATAKTEEKEKNVSIKYDEVKENQYVYSETLKEFKLSSANNLPTNDSKTTNSETFSDKEKDNRVINDHSEKCDPLKHKLDDPIALKTKNHSHQFEISPPKDSKPLPLERKPKSTEHSVTSSKDMHYSPFKALSYKERAQNKQEILTSKIKAHAQKEISAIREKGYAHNPIKHLTIGQSNSIRQKPPSQEVSKTHDTTVSNNVTPKQHMGAIGTHYAVEPERTASNGKSKDEETKQRPKKEDPTGIKSPTKGEELGATRLREQGGKHGDNSGKLKEGIKSKAATIIDLVNEKKEADPSQHKAPVNKAEAAVVKVTDVEETQTPNKAKSENEGMSKDSTPSLKLVLGQSESIVEDDNLQIVGIRVTVRERKPLESNEQVDNAREATPGKERENTKSEPTDSHKYHPGSRFEGSKVNDATGDGCLDPVKERSRVVRGKEETKSGVNNQHPENVQDASNIETVKNKTPVIKEKSSSSNGRSQRETLLQDSLTDKGEHSTVIEPAKNKVLAEAQPFLFKQGIITRKAKDYTSKNLNENSAKSNTEDVIEQDPQPSMKEDVAKYDISSKNSNRDGESAPLLVERRQDAASREENLRNKNGAPLYSLAGNESRHLAAMSKKYTEPHSAENSQAEEDVHIDGIAIRIVPGLIEQDRHKMTENHPTIKSPQNHLTAINENKLVPLPSPDGKTNTSKDEDRAKLFTPASKELTQIKDSLDARYMSPSVRQGAHSLRVGDQHNSGTATSENKQVENGRLEKVKRDGDTADEMKSQTIMTDGDYFQLQGAIETSHEEYNDNMNDGGISDVVSQSQERQSLNQSHSTGHAEGLGSPGPTAGGEITGLQTDKTSISKDPQLSHEPKHIRNAAMNKAVNSGEQVSKQSDGPTERQNNISTKRDVGQDTHVNQHNSANQSYLLAKERHQAKMLHSTRDDTVQQNVDHKAEEKPKPKEKVSTIPDISAIADYARLKVIASEDKADTTQEPPPSKKEDFFPRIGTCHSRRPVFTTESQDPPVKEKMLAKETEVNAKVSKEPKALVLSSMEQEHKRTGLFRLGDKERQETMLPDVKASEGVTDTERTHTQHLKQNTKPTPEHLTIPGGKEQNLSAAGLRGIKPEGAQIVSPVLASSSASSANSKTRTNSLSQHLDQRLHPIHVERPREHLLPPKPEGTHHTDKMAHPQLRLQHMHDMEERRTVQREQERRAKQRVEERAAKIEEERRERQRGEERLAARREEENRAKQREERRAEDERRAKQKEEERRGKLMEEERRAKQREEEKRAEEERRLKQREENNARKEEERRAREREERAAKIEEERREKQRQEERVAAQREEERRTKQREVERRAEEERRAKQIEEERRAKQVEEERAAKIAEERRHIEEENRARQLEERRAKQIEEERRDKQIEEERTAKIAEERRLKQIEEERRIKQIEEEKRAIQLEEERRAKQIEEEMRAKQTEEKRAAKIAEERRLNQIEAERKERLREERIAARRKEEERRENLREEERRAVQKEEEERAKQREEDQKAKQLRQIEEEQMAIQKEEERRAAQERIAAQREEEKRAKQREEEKLAAQSEEEKTNLREEHRRAAQKMDALQYYAISSTEGERRPRDRPLRSPLPSPRRVDPSVVEPAEDWGSHSRPQAPASPAPSLPRSNTSSPALGAKPTMFRVKDNTFRGSSFTKSVKPRFHKSFGEDLRVGSPLDGSRGSERADEEQDRMRRSAGTPVYQDTVIGSHRLAKESSSLQPASSVQAYSAPPSGHRPYSRRSMALDEDDSRSVVSAMSEDVESFATGATDLADLRGLYDSDRPESACSFSSDVGRALGKPPSVPPKSEKALRRAKRLTTRRVKKTLTKGAVDSPVPEEKPVRTVSNVPSSPTDLCSSDQPAFASPHFSSPVSLAHAPTSPSKVPSSTTEMPSSQRSFHTTPRDTASVATPHATAPVATPHATVPVATPHVTAPVSLPNTPRTVASVPSSPTHHHTNHQAPVTQYRVEPGYAQPYPMTQRKVLQDPGSGQYFVVDIPVQVKTKTFFDPETGKYVQLNVRQSAQNGSLPKSQPPYTQPQLQTQPQPNPQPQPSSAAQPYVLYQGYQGYHQGYQPVAVSSLPPHRSSSGMSVPSSVSQETEPGRQRQIYGYQENERGQNSHNYSHKQTTYMDTAHDIHKTCDANTAHNTHASYETCPDYDGQRGGDSVNENDNPVRSSSQARDIITMSELDDFMDVYDW